MAALRDAIALLPRGVAWSQSPDSRLGKLLDALTRELDRVEARAADLLLEANPATTTELLAEWDAIVALDYPALSTTEPDASLARVAIAWLLGTSTLSRESIERYCALSELTVFADGDGVTRPLYRLLSVDHTDTHEATIRLLSDGGSNSVVEALFRRKAHATGTLVFDWVLPAIAITSPADESIACDELVTVTGTSIGVGTVEVVVTESGGLVTTYTTTADSGTGEWSVQIALATYLDGEPATIVARGYTGIVTADSGWVESTPVEVTSEFSVSVSFTGPLTTTEIFPTFTGTATPGSTIVIELRGDTEAPVVADVNGDWSVEMANQGLDLGANELTIYVTGPGPCAHEDSIIVEVEREASGGVAPTITVAPVLTWTVAHGSSPTITEGTYTGDAGTWTYDLVRLPSTTVLSGASKATVEAYVADRATDVGPDWKVTGTITNGSGSDSADSNTVRWYPDVWSGVRGLYDAANVTLVGSDVDTWQDLSGNGNDLVAASSGVRPVHSATGFNGGSQPYVEGDGVAEWLRDTAFGWGGAPTQLAIHAAMHVITPTNGRVIFRYAGVSVRPALAQTTSDRTIWYGFDGTGQVSTTNSLSTARTVSVISAQSGTQKTRFAGVTNPSDRTDGADAHADNATLGVFAAHNATAFSHLRLGMLVIRNVATSDTERQDFEAYSAWRWGLPT